MTASSRCGRILLDTVVTRRGLSYRPDVVTDQKVSDILGDYFWGQVAANPVQIPYSWLSRPQQTRSDSPITSYSLGQTSGETFSGRNQASQQEYGDNSLTGSLATATSVTAQNLGHWTLSYYATQPGATPRTRYSGLLVVLNGHPSVEQRLILSVKIGRCIRITGAPADWPASALVQVVEGIHQVADNGSVTGTAVRAVQWNTVPVVGTVDGVEGPWFRLNQSSLLGTDVTPF